MKNEFYLFQEDISVQVLEWAVGFYAGFDFGLGFRFFLFFGFSMFLGWCSQNSTNVSFTYCGKVAIPKN
jgi:hypothetical protein